MSIKTKVYNALSTGRTLTPAQLAGMFKTTQGTVRARVSDLRREGVEIFNTTNRSGKGAYTTAG